MNIAMVSTFPPDECGIGDYAQGYCNALSPWADLTVITYGLSGFANGDVEQPGYKIYRSLPRRATRSIFRRLFGEIKPDIVHIQSSTFLHHPSVYRACTKSTSLPVVATVHDVPRGWKQTPWRIQLESFYDRCGSILVHSPRVKEGLTSVFAVPDEIVILAPIGVDTRYFHPTRTETSSTECGAKHGFTFGFFGFVRPRKGLELLLNAYAKTKSSLKNTRLVIVGGDRPVSRGDIQRPPVGTYAESLRRLAKSLCISQDVTLTGHVPLRTLPELLGKIDAFVFPYEGSPSASGAVPVPLAMGKPVVVTDVDYFKQLIGSSGAALFVPRESVQDLVDVMELLYRDSELRERLSRRAREFSLSELSWEKTAPDIRRSYQHLTSS